MACVLQVQMCQDEKAFKLLQKNLQNTHETADADGDGPRLPTSTVPLEQRVRGMQHQAVNVMRFRPLPVEDEPGDFLMEASTSSLLSPVSYDSWNRPFALSASLGQLLDKLLESVQYQYLAVGSGSGGHRHRHGHGHQHQHGKAANQSAATNTSTAKAAANENATSATNSTTTNQRASTITITGDAKQQQQRPAPQDASSIDPTSSILINDVRKEMHKLKKSIKVGFYPVTKVGPAKDRLKDKTRASSNPVEEYDVGYAYSGRQSGSRRQRTISGRWAISHCVWMELVAMIIAGRRG